MPVCFFTHLLNYFHVPLFVFNSKINHYIESHSLILVGGVGWVGGGVGGMCECVLNILNIYFESSDINLSITIGPYCKSD